MAASQMVAMIKGYAGAAKKSEREREGKKTVLIVQCAVCLKKKEREGEVKGQPLILTLPSLSTV